MLQAGGYYSLFIIVENFTTAENPWKIAKINNNEILRSFKNS